MKHPTKITEKNCKHKTIIEVDSHYYNEDESYRNSINQKLENYELL